MSVVVFRVDGHRLALEKKNARCGNPLRAFKKPRSNNSEFLSAGVLVVGLKAKFRWEFAKAIFDIPFDRVRTIT